jgi:hypothetical protein
VLLDEEHRQPAPPGERQAAGEQPGPPRGAEPNLLVRGLSRLIGLDPGGCPPSGRPDTRARAMCTQRSTWGQGFGAPQPQIVTPSSTAGQASVSSSPTRYAVSPSAAIHN